MVIFIPTFQEKGYQHVADVANQDDFTDDVYSESDEIGSSYFNSPASSASYNYSFVALFLSLTSSSLYIYFTNAKNIE